jgi:hypothetical protein
MMVIGIAGFMVGSNDGGSAVVGMRLLLWTWVLGMAGYTLYAIGALDVLGVHNPDRESGARLAGVVGGLLPLVAYVVLGRLVKRLRQERSSPT